MMRTRAWGKGSETDHGWKVKPERSHRSFTKMGAGEAEDCVLISGSPHHGHFPPLQTTACGRSLAMAVPPEHVTRGESHRPAHSGRHLQCARSVTLDFASWIHITLVKCATFPCFIVQWTSECSRASTQRTVRLAHGCTRWLHPRYVAGIGTVSVHNLFFLV